MWSLLKVVLLISSVRAQLCDTTKCLEKKGKKFSADSDCCGLTGQIGCSKGYTFSIKKVDWSKCIWTTSTCCTPPECSDSWCTSPTDVGDKNANDCWAGSKSEACTCSKGSARMTGDKMEYKGSTYYQYTCCTSEDNGKNVGEKCGDHDGHKVLIIIGIVIAVLFVLSVIVGLCLCYRSNPCCSRNRFTSPGQVHSPPPQFDMAGSQNIQMVPMYSSNSQGQIVHTVPVQNIQMIPDQQGTPMQFSNTQVQVPQMIQPQNININTH